MDAIFDKKVYDNDDPVICAGESEINFLLDRYPKLMRHTRIRGNLIFYKNDKVKDAILQIFKQIPIPDNYEYERKPTDPILSESCRRRICKRINESAPRYTVDFANKDLLEYILSEINLSNDKRCIDIDIEFQADEDGEVFRNLIYHDDAKVRVGHEEWGDDIEIDFNGMPQEFTLLDENGGPAPYVNGDALIAALRQAFEENYDEQEYRFGRELEDADIRYDARRDAR